MKVIQNQEHLNKGFQGLIGVSQRDITPPIGIYSKNWGAGHSDFATGIHRPLYFTCLTLQSSINDLPIIIITADLGWWKTGTEEINLRNGLLSRFNIPDSNLLFCLSHTHSGPSLTLDDKEKVGGHLIEEYLTNLLKISITAIEEALKYSKESSLEWRYSTCDLATNRDLFDPLKNKFYVGYNPSINADQTLLIGKVSDLSGELKAVLVNYACHPTTLAWENTLISPDYIGAMRELIEDKTNAKVLFFQGASGDLAPVEQYTGDIQIADKHGYRLGYAVLSSLEGFKENCTQLEIKEFIESGAPLVVWENKPFQLSSKLEAEKIEVLVDLKAMPTFEELEVLYNNCDDNVEKERLFRKKGLRKKIGNETSYLMPIWIIRIGGAIIVAQSNELYSEFQVILREQFKNQPILIANIVNGYIGYIPSIRYYSNDMYSVSQTPFEKDTFNRVLKQVTNNLNQIIE